MTPQVDLNVVCPVRPGEVEAALATLAPLAARPADNELIPFGRLAGVHFARLLLIDAATGLQGEPIPAQLVLMADLDGPLEARLAELVETAGCGLDAVFQHCDGYPGPGATPALRLAFLRAHSVRSDAFYTNTVGRTVLQIRQEAELREAIEGMLDQGDWAGQEPTRVRARVQELVRCRPELAWAGSRARERDLGWRVRQVVVWLVAVPLLVLAVAVLLLPATLLALLVFVALLRIHELRDRPSDQVPSPEHVAELTAIEDHGPQNQFTVVGFLKPGPFRRLTERVVLLLTDYGTRHVFNHLSLAGVKTIHFARWVPLDGRRRMIFASSYDGSVESYMDDFIDKIAWGLNATFSSGLGYPRTAFLLFGGAHDELRFKNVLRRSQVVTQVWYSAYDHLTCLNIERNARIRAGLSGDMTAAQAEQWLALL
jgi:hypothetical protein